MAAREHDRLIASAARSQLSPIGCKQKGRSRTWISDEGYWAVVVEFQPSSWSKGAYLNVAASWLWHSREHWTLAYGLTPPGSRVLSFTEFESVEQFTGVADAYAKRAAEAVLALRTTLSSLCNVYKFLGPLLDDRAFRTYDVAVAAGLVGELGTARELLEAVQEGSPDEIVERDCATVMRHISDVVTFREAVLGIVERSRAHHKLPPDPPCLERAARGISRSSRALPRPSIRHLFR